MSRRSFHPVEYALLRLMVFLGGLSLFALGQEKTQQSMPIDLDRELEVRVAADLAQSYYHYALAEWDEDNGDVSKALSEMRTALKYNQKSAAVHLALASLLEKTGNTHEAMEHAQDAARLDPKDPDSHWLLANMYFRSQGQSPSAKEAIRRGVQELETLNQITPGDERPYYALGGAYFELGEPEKAIQAYEKFQSLEPNTDAGYREIAKYYERTGNNEKAIEYLTEAIGRQPDSTESLIMLASLYSKLGKNKESIPLYRKPLLPINREK